MPGRTPQEAVENFLEPLRQATLVLDAYTQILVKPKRGGYRKGEIYTWMLNGPDGADLGHVGRFTASMRFEIIDADPAKHEGGGLRCTTRGYLYGLHQQGLGDRWLIHWHPDGASPVKDPHIHIPPDLSLHHSSGRISFEQAIRWCIQAGAPITCSREDAENHLAEVEAPYQLHRSWVRTPDEPRG